MLKRYSSLPTIVSHLRITDVGLRDGLQVLTHHIPLESKCTLLEMMIDAGLRNIEVGSCVSPSVTPMCESESVAKRYLDRDATLSLLVLNRKGLLRARNAGVTNYNICISLDNGFNERNFGRSMGEMLDEYVKMLRGGDRRSVRAYISHAFEGDNLDNGMQMLVETLSTVASTIVLADTNGKSALRAVESTIRHFSRPDFTLGVHFHKGDSDVWRRVDMAYDLGVREFDTSITNFGGCINIEDPTANISTLEMMKWANNRGIVLDSQIYWPKVTAAMEYADSLAEPARCAAA